jgi:hypothetical protein
LYFITWHKWKNYMEVKWKRLKNILTK